MAQALQAQYGWEMGEFVTAFRKFKKLCVLKRGLGPSTDQDGVQTFNSCKITYFHALYLPFDVPRIAVISCFLEQNIF